jgi:hypothetical protein
MSIARKVLALILFLASAALWADFELTHWRYFKSIQFKGAQLRQLISVPVDDPVLRNCHSLENELRVIESAAVETPFNIVSDSDEVIEDNRFPVTLLNKSVLQGQYQQFICDLGGPGRITNHMRLETPDKGFVRRADVDGSDDREKWFSLAKGLHIFDWSEGRKVSIEFPDSAYRYLRVLLWLDGSKPLAIDVVSVARHERREGELESVEAILRSHTPLTSGKFSEWVFDFVHGHPLVNRCVLDIANANFRRRLDLATSDDAQRWQPGPSLELFRTTSGEIKDEFTSVETNALNRRYLRIRVYNGDDRPLDVKGIRFHRFIRRIVFEYDPGKSYRLYYDNDSAHRPSYDLTAMESRSRQLALPQGKLGDQQANPDYVDPRERQPWTERHPRVLWGVLVAVVLLLGGLLLKSIMSMRGKAA